MSTIINITTTDGLSVELNTEDVDFIEVADADSTDEDYMEAVYFNLVMKDDQEYLIDTADNLDPRETLLNLFQTM
ncbi:hypothetical protein [Nostoc sp. CALU 1950]|uniref:hypothetical protein n=1 Tax=Nostoc sp. CALU 1950 TaxID=3104321 RepID=UPI003EBCB5D2